MKGRWIRVNAQHHALAPLKHFACNGELTEIDLIAGDVASARGRIAEVWRKTP
jgi:hypothetical protein